MNSPDIVVIGGGVIGTAITYYLAKADVNVCLIERADIASGTSSASATGVSLQTKPPGPKQELARASVELFRGLNEELAADIEFVNDGGMLVAETAEEYALIIDKAHKATAAGVAVDILPTDDALAAQPCLASHIVGATYCADDSTVNPYVLAFAFVRAAQRLGAEIRTYTEVIGIERDGDKITAVLTAQGKIATATVVNAAGPWSPKLAELAGVTIPIEPRKGELYVTEPTPPFLHGSIISASYLLSKSMPEGDDAQNTLRVGLWAGQTTRGNLLVGSTREFAGYDRSSTYRGIQALVEQTIRLIPAAANLHILRFYAGLRPTTPDGLPILGRHPLLPGLILANGHEGDGIALSPITGKHIADLITGKIHEDVELAAFSPRRFGVAQYSG